MNRSAYAFCQPRRVRCRQDFANADGLRRVRPFVERAIAVMHHIARRLVPGERFTQLLRRPRRGRMLGYGYMDDYIKVE